MLTTPVARVDLTSDVIYSDECRPPLALFDRSSTRLDSIFLGYLHHPRRREPRQRMRKLAFLQLLPLKSFFFHARRCFANCERKQSRDSAATVKTPRSREYLVENTVETFECCIPSQKRADHRSVDQNRKEGKEADD